MGFDLKKYRTAKFTERTKDVPVPQLKDWFTNGDKPVFVVRGLEGEELFEVRTAVEKNRNTQEILEKLVSGEVGEKVEAALRALGIGDDLPDDYVRRLHTVKLGLKKPKSNLEDIKLIAKRHPVLFTNLSEEIMALTGMGQLGESSASGQTRK
jgi:hypothetical protein